MEKVLKNDSGVIESTEVQSTITPQKDFYTLEYIESVWGLDVRHLRKMIKDGSLRAKFVARRYFVLHSDLLDYISNGDEKKKHTSKG
jgi:hypothetical protein